MEKLESINELIFVPLQKRKEERLKKLNNGDEDYVCKGEVQSNNQNNNSLDLEIDLTSPIRNIEINSPKKSKRKLENSEDQNPPSKKRRKNNNEKENEDDIGPSSINEILVTNTLSNEECQRLEKEFGISEQEERSLHDHDRKKRYNEWKYNFKGFGLE